MDDDTLREKVAYLGQTMIDAIQDSVSVQQAYNAIGNDGYDLKFEFVARIDPKPPTEEQLLLFDPLEGKQSAVLTVTNDMEDPFTKLSSTVQ